MPKRTEELADPELQKILAEAGVTQSFSVHKNNGYPEVNFQFPADTDHAKPICQQCKGKTYLTYKCISQTLDREGVRVNFENVKAYDAVNECPLADNGDLQPYQLPEGCLNRGKETSPFLYEDFIQGNVYVTRILTILKETLNKKGVKLKPPSLRRVKEALIK